MEENQTETKRCPFCAEEIRIEAVLCKHCSTDLRPAGLASNTERLAPSGNDSQVDNQGLGFSISSILIGTVAVVAGLINVSGVSQGLYLYIDDAEVGLLMLLAGTSLGLAIPAYRKKQRLRVGALIVAITSWTVVFLAAQFTL